MEKKYSRTEYSQKTVWAYIATLRGQTFGLTHEAILKNLIDGLVERTRAENQKQQAQ